MTTDTDGGSADGDARLVTLEWDTGREERVALSPGECIVDAAEADGSPLPFGCLYGACATCTAELLGGDVEHMAPVHGLKPQAVREGYGRPCIATPRTDCQIRVGHSSQAEVVGTPWQ